MTSENPASARRAALGRGLDALFAGSPTHAILPTKSDRATELITIDPAVVEPNPEQPRRNFDPQALADLADSIRAHGLLHPIVVEVVDGNYRLVAGERRLRAARLAEIAAIPAIVKPPAESGRHLLELALTENLQRSELSPIEEATAYSRLADTFGLSHEAIARRVGKSRPAVTNAVRLLGLPATVQQALASGAINVGHARALLAIPSAQAQEDMAQQIVANELSVRQVEQQVAELTALRESANGNPRRTRSRHVSPDDEALRSGLEHAVGLPVQLIRRRKGGRLIIDFSDDTQLDALYNKLGGSPL